MNTLITLFVQLVASIISQKRAGTKLHFGPKPIKTGINGHLLGSTAFEMVIDEAHRLHCGIGGCGSAEPPTELLQRFG